MTSRNEHRACGHSPVLEGGTSASSVEPHLARLDRRTRRIWGWLLPVAGLLSLIWFILRVAPKPSRATYPCQRAAAPLAGGFVIWLGGLVGSWLIFRRAGICLRQNGRWLTVACIATAAALAIVAVIHSPDALVTGAAPDPLTPIGVARGVHPGRVVWVHEPTATNWAGPGDGHWWEDAHTDQAVVERMLASAIRTLAGATSDAAAWDALIHHFNRTTGRGDVGYTPGEKICIKVNFVGCIASGGNVDPVTYNLVNNLDYMNTSPQVMRALLRQLVNVVGASQADISIGDPTCLFPNQFHDPLKAEFPNVRYLDHDGGNTSHPRTLVTMSSVPFYWSARPSATTQDYVPTAYAQATYFINLANFKAHASAGVTLSAKNHYGSLKRYPAQSGYYSMHKTLADLVRESGQYRCLVDLMGHAHTGRKTLVYLFDGLYSGIHPLETSPRKWNSAPFNGDWTSSLFASQDPVAIDSVGYDFLYNEWLQPRLAGTEDYLHEAALADSPPSGTFYDPDHSINTTRLPSLGTHEHWNDPQHKQYSRNLGTGNGIELLQSGHPVARIQASPTAGWPPLTVQFDASGSTDLDGSIVSYAWDFDGDGTVDSTSGPLASHLYTHSGRFTASLEVRDNDGFADTATAEINVTRQLADFNDDRDVDQEDYSSLQLCFGNGPGVPWEPGCEGADLNGDGSVDQQDAVVFHQCMTPPGDIADPNCGV